MQHDASDESRSGLAGRDDDDIDLRPIFAELWKARKLILTGTIIIVTGALLANELLGKYWSTARFKIDNASPTAYKDLPSVFQSVDRFQAFASTDGVSDKESVTFIEGLISLPPEQLERYASIANSVSSKDGKESAIAKSRVNEPEAGIFFIEMNLKMPGPNPAASQLRSRLFTEYFADTFIYLDLLKWLESVRAEREDAVISNKLEAIRVQRSIDEANMRLVALRSLTKRIPEALRVGSSQLISVGVRNDMSEAVKGGGQEFGRRRILGEGVEIFLSPVAQIIAAESVIIDRKIDLFKLQRKQKQSDLAHEFYKQAAAMGVTTKSGREFIKKLLVLKEGFFRDITASDALSMEVVYEISRELEQRQLKYASGLKFLSGPSLPDGKSKKSPLLVVFGAGVGGLFVMVALALLIAWWRKNAKSFSAINGFAATEA